MASELGVGTTFWFDLPLEQSDKDELMTKTINNEDNFSSSQINEFIQPFSIPLKTFCIF